MRKYSVILQNFKTDKKLRVVTTATTGDDAVMIAKDHISEPHDWFMVNCTDYDPQSYTDLPTLQVPQLFECEHPVEQAITNGDQEYCQKCGKYSDTTPSPQA